MPEGEYRISRGEKSTTRFLDERRAEGMRQKGYSVTPVGAEADVSAFGGYQPVQQDATPDLSPPRPAPRPASARRPAPEPQEKVSIMDAVGRGARDMAGMNFTDEAAGFGAWLNPASDTPRATRGIAGRPIETTDYDVGKAAETQMLGEALEEHPKSFRTGQALGLAASLALPGGAAAQGATKAQMAARAMGAGALMGGTAAAGATEDPSASGQAFDVLGGALGGAAIGPLAGKAVGSVAKPVSQYLAGRSGQAATKAEQAANRQMLAAAGAERGAMRKLAARKGGVDRYATGMREQGIGKGMPKTTAGIRDQAEVALERVQKRKTELIEAIAPEATVSGKDVAARVRAMSNARGKGPAGAQRRKELESIAKEFEEMGDVPWSEMNAERMDWGNAVNFDSQTIRAKMSKQVYGEINEAMTDAAEDVSAGLGRSWRKANELEHVALKAIETGDNKLSASGNHLLSLSTLGNLVRGREHSVAEKALGGAAKGLRGFARRAEAAPANMGQAARKLSSRLAGELGPGTGARLMGTGAMAEGEPEETATGEPATAAAMALEDEQYGALLRSRTDEEREVMVSVLSQTDDEFRRRQRQRAEQQEQQ